jgi:hypothetical protein
MHERANFYLALGLDPNVSDGPAIATAIRDARRRWSTEAVQGSMAARRKAKLYLDQLPDIERVMNDPEARHEEAVAARRAQEMQRKARMSVLDEAIAVVRADGMTCSRERATQMFKEFGDSFSEPEIVERLRLAGISIAQPEKTPATSATEKARLDAARMAGLRPKLELLGVANLYEFLEMKPVSSPRALSDQADATLKEILRVGRTDPESSTRKELCGECIALFRTDADKEKYDNALALEPLEALRARIGVAGADGFLTIEVQDELLRQARALGVSAADARAYIEEHARKRKWRLMPAAKLPSEDLRQCGYCFALQADSRAQNCRACGDSLLVACPRCGSTMPTTHAACTSCGYRVGDAPIVKSLLHEGQQRALAGDFVAALASIDRALLYWPGWEPATTVRKDIEERRAARDAALAALEALVRAQNLVEARDAMDRLRRRFGSAGAERFEERITAGLSRAEALEREGETLRAAGRIDEALVRYEQALEECADLSRARAALSAFPPAAPCELRAEPLRAGFRLQWQAPNERGRLRYCVLRKELDRPRHRADGTVVAEIDDARFDDPGAPAGTPLYYAIYAVRGEVASLESAAVGPLLLAAEVADAHVLAGDNVVTLRWQRPNGAKRVEVWRGVGAAPARRGEGRQLVAGETGMQDADVRNGERYGYRIVAVYDDPSQLGLERFATGSVVAATPAPPPPAITDLRAERVGSRVTLAWTSPPNAAVQIRRAAQAPDVPPGAIVALDGLERFGTLLDTPARGHAEYAAAAQGRLVFVPITVGSANAVVGLAATIVTVDDVTNVRAKTNGRDIVLTWDWPHGADEVVVCYANDRYPAAPDDAGATRAHVTQAGYTRANRFELRAAKPDRHFFTLFVVASSGTLYSAGARVFESMGQGTIVRYRAGVKKRGLFNRAVESAWVELECDEPIVSLPPLIVLGKDGRQPLSPGDGALLAEEPALQFASGRARIELPAERATRSTYVKVFFKDGRHAQEIRLQPASSELLRLG